MEIAEGVKNNPQLREARRKQKTKVYTGFLVQEVEQAAKQIGTLYRFTHKDVLIIYRHLPL